MTDVPRDSFEWLDGGMALAVAADRATRLSDVYAALTSVACGLANYTSAAVYIADEQQDLWIRGWSGPGRRLLRLVNDRPAVHGFPTPALQSYTGNAAVAVPDVDADAARRSLAPFLAGEGIRSLLAVPIQTSRQKLGVLECYCAVPHDPSCREIALLEHLARIGGFAIDIVRRRLEDEQHRLRLEEDNRRLRMQSEWLERAQMIEARLMKVLLEDQSFDCLASVLATSLDCTALVEEVGVLHPHTALAGAELVPEASEALRTGRVSARRQRPHPAGRPTVISNDFSTGMPGGLAAPAMLEGEPTGWVSTYRAQPFDRFERRTVERAAIVMAALGQRERAEREVEWRLSREFFDQLLATTPGSDTDAIIDRGLHLGVDLRRPNVVLVFRSEPDLADSDVGEAVDARTTRLISSVQRAVDASTSHAMAIARADHVVVLYPASPPEEVDALIARLQDKMRAVRGLERLSIAVSTVCRDSFDYEPTYRAALTALSLGKPGAEGRVVRVPDLGVYALLLNARRPDELVEFATTTVSALRQYDEQNSTDLVETLKTYLEERGKLPATAARMFVHPNTVSYRLNRIRDITGGHPSEMDVALRFELAFMIERLAGTCT
jgi:sugar diacid utilization regulator